MGRTINKHNAYCCCTQSKLTYKKHISYVHKYTVCIKKRLPFEIQISHNYSDLIVLKCVELMTRDKKRVLFTKAINRSCPIKSKSFVLRLAK